MHEVGSMYNQPRVYNQGGGGTISSGVDLDGYKKTMFTEVSGNADAEVLLAANADDLKFKFSNKVIIEFFIPTLIGTSTDDKEFSIFSRTQKKPNANRGYNIRFFNNTQIIINMSSDYGLPNRRIYYTSAGDNFGMGNFCTAESKINTTNRENYGFFNGQSVSFGARSSEISCYFTLFKNLNSNLAQFFAGTKIFSFRIFDADGKKVLMDLQPVKRIIDSQAGFFDLVSGTFYTCGNSNGLTAGIEID
jgi:hypothetical protein